MTAASIRDEYIYPTPFLDHARHHRLDRLVITDIHLDTQRGSTRRLDLGNRALGGHVFRLGLELLVRAQIEVSDGDLGAQPGEPLRVGSTETTRAARYDRNLSVQLPHGGPFFARYGLMPDSSVF
jgi:hypothetical protein